MRTLFRQILAKTSLAKRKLRKVDHSIIEDYFSENEQRKLHIGCSENIIAGWLNSDLSPTSDSVLQLDATKRFPFELERFNYIFSEHMIEHVSYSHGFAMLKECYRVLENNGKIRISTPDLQFLINLYKNEKSDLQVHYIEWATERFIHDSPEPDDCFVINNFVRNWGHLFIYDEKTLRSLLERAGFSDIVRCELNKSESSAFQNLENETRMPEGFLELESFTLEGVKVVDN